MSSDEPSKNGLPDVLLEYNSDDKPPRSGDSEELNSQTHASKPKPKSKKPPKKSGNPKSASADEFIQDEIPHRGTSVKTRQDRRFAKGSIAFVEKRYSPDRSRERARAVLAVVLTLLLSLVVLILVVAVVLGTYQTKDAVSFLGVLLSPLVALVGAATGFYYGGKAANKKS